MLMPCYFMITRSSVYGQEAQVWQFQKTNCVIIYTYVPAVPRTWFNLNGRTGVILKWTSICPLSVYSVIPDYFESQVPNPCRAGQVSTKGGQIDSRVTSCDAEISTNFDNLFPFFFTNKMKKASRFNLYQLAASSPKICNRRVTDRDLTSTRSKIRS